MANEEKGKKGYFINVDDDELFSVDYNNSNTAKSQPKTKTKNVSSKSQTKKPAKTVQTKTKKKKKKGRPNGLVYLISVLVMLAMIFLSYKLYTLLAGYTFLPEKYIKLLKYVLIGLCCFFSIYAFLPNVNNLNKIIQIVLCGALCFGLFKGLEIVPTYKGKLERMFPGNIPKEGELNINFYAMADSEIVEVDDIAGSRVGYQTAFDTDYQEYAWRVLNRELENEEVEKVPFEDIFSLVDALYAGEIDVMMLNKTYADSLIAKNDDFLEFHDETKIVYTSIQQITIEYDSNAVGNITTEPFIVLVGGNDEWDTGYVLGDYGRTDVQMVATVNPVTKQILIVNIPRDAYVSLWDAGYAYMDKLTHSTVYGVSCWKETLDGFLNIDSNYYVRVNFSAVLKFIDALGGVDIYNPYAFDSDAVYLYDESTGRAKIVAYRFEEGNLHLDGTHALGYARERHHLPGGDAERSNHQAVILKAMIEKATSVSTITNVAGIMDAVAGTYACNININEIYALVNMQLSDMASWEILRYEIKGTGAYDTCYAMGPNSNLYVMYPDDASVNQASSYIHRMLNGEKITVE